MGTIYYPPDWDGPRPDDAEASSPPPSPPSTPPAPLPRAARSRPQLPGAPARPLVVGVCALLVVALGGYSFTQNSSARKWRHDERVEASRTALVSDRLTAADSAVTSLQSQVTSLKGEVSKLQAKLSKTANAKEHALDTNAVAGRVSQELSQCVDDMQFLISEIATDISGQFFDPNLNSNAAIAGNACGNAQAANNELQAILRGDG
jgi:hypothetical protein